MNAGKEHMLATLLLEALPSVAITRSASEQLTHRAFRQMVGRYRSMCDPVLRSHTFTYKVIIGDSVVRDTLLNLLRDELKQFTRDDRTFSATFRIFGGLSSGSTVDDILTNLVKAAIVKNPQEAAKAFYNSIALGYVTFQDYFLLTGIRVEKEVQVFDGISLIPLPNSTEHLPGHLSDLFRVDMGDFLSKTLLRVDMSVSPILYKPDQNYTIQSGPDRHFSIALRSVDVTDFYPHKFFQALTLVGEHPVQSAVHWTYLSDEHIFDLRIGPGSGYSYSSMAISNASSTIFSEALVSDAVNLYSKMVRLPQDVQDQLRIPIDRLLKSKTNQAQVDKMIDLGIALESFYLAGIGDRDQLSFRFRLRASLYLGESTEDRRQLIREFREIYDCRSKAVHEGTLPEEVRIEGQTIQIREFIARAQDLCEQSLLKVIREGQAPNWTNIELGGGDN